jgi:hypothetical protein
MGPVDAGPQVCPLNGRPTRPLTLREVSFDLRRRRLARVDDGDAKPLAARGLGPRLRDALQVELPNRLGQFRGRVVWQAGQRTQEDDARCR